MEESLGGLDKWRNYFRTPNLDIFDIIEHAIMVAAVDCPQELKLRRDNIAEMLFTCVSTRCYGCGKVELAVPNVEGEEVDHKCKVGLDPKFEDGVSKESRADSYRDGDMVMNGNRFSGNNYLEAEALTDEIEEESQIFEEVLRIKEVLNNIDDQSESVLFDCVRKLQLMHLSVETLQATEIGKSVNAIRKHGSKRIQNLVKTVIREWKLMVDEWVKATQDIAGTETTPESVKTSVHNEEEGLPSPPLDEGAFFTTLTAPLEFSQFFDGMDDDGNLQNTREFNENQRNSRKPSLENQNVSKQNPRIPKDSSFPIMDKMGEQSRRRETAVKEETATKPNKHFVDASAAQRVTKFSSECIVNNNDMKIEKKTDKAPYTRRPMASEQEKISGPNNNGMQMKLEVAKRKLHERYQEAENAKKQKKIQVMELHDIPKSGLGHRNPHMRNGQSNRRWQNGRH